MIYLYDANGSPIGMQYRTTSYAEGVFDTYWFEKNLQGDIVAVYNDAGTLLATYAYDAWGGIASLRYSNGGSSTAAQYNPFRYRGYYRDSETGFYYLNSRYYDPNTGRFINADGIVAGTSGDIHGFNLYTYCFNNPVSMSDSEGNWPSWNDIKNGAKKFVRFLKDVGDDIKNFDIHNTDEQTVINSNYFSAYKGKLAFRIDGNRSGSFIFMFISRKTTSDIDGYNDVRHEYGHTKQLDQLIKSDPRGGLLKYALFIGIPSWQEWGEIPNSKIYNYYKQPWEVTADVYGGVTGDPERYHSSVTIDAGWEHLERAKYWDLLYLYGQSIW